MCDTTVVRFHVFLSHPSIPQEHGITSQLREIEPCIFAEQEDSFELNRIPTHPVLRRYIPVMFKWTRHFRLHK
ncbi:hypothetical protein NDU88_003467 [Pleurodeles waltl]|uniref:Uncharacterized protein n=1 Tax=Pleurodeles waltl TaxID=8319 RepID=A0AAV7NI98_PLEWA|nr:hypothetical protein NDU88_003467 [Pleurodeles waltl]